MTLTTIETFDYNFARYDTSCRASRKQRAKFSDDFGNVEMI